MLSLDGENNWRGFSVNDTENPSYWEKDENGNVISDHSSAECDFTLIKTSDFVENTQELNKTEPTENKFVYKLKWLWKALVMILSDLRNIPELIKSLGEL